MGLLNNIRLKTKLFSVVAFLILVSVGISGTVYVYVRHIIEQTAVMKRSSEHLQSAGRATANLLAYARNVEFLPLELTAEQRRQFELGAADERRRLLVRLDSVVDAEPSLKKELDAVRALLADYQRDIELSVVKLGQANDLDGATKIAFKGADSIEAMRQHIRKFEDANLKSVTSEMANLVDDQNRLLQLIVTIAITGSVLGLLAAFTTIILGITKPLMKIIDTMHYIASGKTDRAVEGTERLDELGGMAKAVETFRENAVERLRLEARARQERDAEVHRQKQTDALIGQFRSSIMSIRAALDSELDGMKTSSEALTRIAMDAADGASSAQAASSEASSNVGDVANAAGELTSASREISTQVHKASECVTRAMSVAKEADQGISSLAELADRIGAIVHMINGIAEQTNMLALNATIEAARAGDAGRSFAVVASEVKTLAGQTAKATEEISQQIASIQSATHGAVGLIRSISDTVSEIQGRTTAIAAAVEEQEASTHEISRSISLASSGSGRVASDVSAMASSVEKTSDEASQLRLTSDKLANVAGELSRSVEAFLEGVTRDVSDRRSATRRASRELVLISHGSRRISTRALDISEAGLRIEAETRLEEKTPIEVEFLNGDRAKAVVVWCANGQAGLKLDQRIPQILVDAMAA